MITVHPADRGCRLELRVRYTIGGLAGRAVERATIGPARRQIVQALTNLVPSSRTIRGEVATA